MIRFSKHVLVIGLSLFPLIASANTDKTIKVGSKKFTESVILGEVITQHLQSNGLDTSRSIRISIY